MVVLMPIRLPQSGQRPDPAPHSCGRWRGNGHCASPDADCDPSEYRLIHLAQEVCGVGCGGLGPPWKGLEFGGPEEHNRLWMLPIGRRGSVVVIDALWTPGATAADLDELRAVVGSIELATPNATPAPQAASS